MSDPPPINLPPGAFAGPTREECDCILGMYIGRWGEVELAVSELIRRLLETDTITSEIIIRALGNMQAQREIAAELGKHRLYKTEFNELEGLLDRVKTAATRRNRIVHGAWRMMIEMGTPPNPKPFTAKRASWQRWYRPAQMEEVDALHRGKSQKLTAAYTFGPDDLRRYAEQARTLATSLQEFTGRIRLKPPRVPLPVEW